MVLVLAMLAGRLVSRIKLPSILGWLIIGMLFGPHALGLMPQPVLDSVWYKTVIMWMQCAFGLMLGTELVWKELKSCGKGLIVTTLTQSLGTFFFVTLVFAIAFLLAGLACLPRLYLRRDCAGYRPCAGLVHRKRIPRKGACNQYIAANGGIR